MRASYFHFFRPKILSRWFFLFALTPSHPVGNRGKNTIRIWSHIPAHCHHTCDLFLCLPSFPPPFSQSVWIRVARMNILNFMLSSDHSPPCGSWFIQNTMQWLLPPSWGKLSLLLPWTHSAEPHLPLWCSLPMTDAVQAPFPGCFSPPPRHA